MEIIPADTIIEGLLLVKPKKLEDERGFFYESYRKDKWMEKQLKIEFVQDNISFSAKNILRGLHFQEPPYAQAKLVSVLRGAVLDVAVDLRKNSITYGEHFKIILSAKDTTQMFVPAGFAHGYLVLEDNTLFSYKCTEYYKKEAENGLSWNDETLQIDWGISHPVLSAKDKKYKPFTAFKSQF